MKKLFKDQIIKQNNEDNIIKQKLVIKIVLLCLLSLDNYCKFLNISSLILH